MCFLWLVLFFFFICTCGARRVHASLLLVNMGGVVASVSWLASSEDSGGDASL